MTDLRHPLVLVVDDDLDTRELYRVVGLVEDITDLMSDIKGALAE